MKIYQENGVVYRLGRNAKENSKLIADADPGDWWFHLEGTPSGHCIVESVDLNKDQIQRAAVLVKMHSLQKGEKKKCRVLYCRVAEVTPTKNPGRVLVNRTVCGSTHV
jgi:predicted ribosome quality control (RQC) complex YloA/Tae2 family protein